MTTAAVAGATGFVGRSLVPALAERCDVVALGRRTPAEDGEESAVRWRRCDLFSLRETEEALEGADVAYYLVHSMLPTARLTQANFEDLDLLLADNFGRAAAACKVKRIVYLGGLLPPEEECPEDRLSTHLRSRLEVEHALAAHGVPVTAVRAGLVVGSGGSSLRILVRLVERLPAMLCPSWTATLTQPIALEDVVAVLCRCLDDEETFGRVCEVGGPDVLSYRDMMRRTAHALHKRRVFVPVPLFTPALSRLWVTLVTGSDRNLVSPLVQSLRHTMVAQDPWLQRRMRLPGKPFEDSLLEALRAEGLFRESVARSIQRLPLPAGRDAVWVAREYTAWLPRFMRPFLRVDFDGTVGRFYLRGIRDPLLELTYQPDRSDAQRALFAVSGGQLAGTTDGYPRLEFRITPDGRRVMAAVQDFRPRLPWWLYAATQARVHAFVMWGFGRHLGRIARGASAPVQLGIEGARPADPGTPPRA